jgi:hypothetical protein
MKGCTAKKAIKIFYYGSIDSKVHKTAKSLLNGRQFMTE